MKWRPKVRVCATDRGLLWAGFWACLSISTLSFFMWLAGPMALDLQQDDLPNLILPAAEYAVPDPDSAATPPAPTEPEAAEAEASPAAAETQEASSAAPARETSDEVPVMLPGAWLIWLFFGMASVVLWLVLIGTPGARGRRYTS